MKYADCSDWMFMGTRRCVVFQCEDEVRLYTVYVSSEAIADDLGEGDPLDVAKQHSNKIEILAGHLIANQRYDDDGNVLIKSGQL